jgi:hypothetical protein
MFGRGVKLFNLMGFEVRLHSSWLILAALVAWSLADGFFPRLPATEGCRRQESSVWGFRSFRQACGPENAEK